MRPPVPMRARLARLPGRLRSPQAVVALALLGAVVLVAGLSVWLPVLFPKPVARLLSTFGPSPSPPAFPVAAAGAGPSRATPGIADCQPLDIEMKVTSTPDDTFRTGRPVTFVVTYRNDGYDPCTAYSSGLILGVYDSEGHDLDGPTVAGLTASPGTDPMHAFTLGVGATHTENINWGARIGHQGAGGAWDYSPAPAGAYQAIAFNANPEDQSPPFAFNLSG
ncbi:MAG: hypothetical protein ACYDAY_06330 [Candidatus Dormibacteria bacterium]